MHQVKLDEKLEHRLTEQLQTFQKRLTELLDTQKPGYWAEHAGISKSLIANRWKEGSFPRADNMIKILMLSGFSANWLFLGHGSRNLSETRSQQDIAHNENERRSIQEKIFNLEEKYEAAQEQIEQLKLQLQVKKQTQWLASVLDPVLNENALDGDDAKKRFNESVLPILNIIQSFLLLTFKSLEASAKSEDGGKRLVAVISWIKRNFEKNNYALLSDLSELDELHHNDSIS